ncbi:MAG: MazG-like family protein [Firmicutes bacterium ADurb.Bin456]|nr:MAG: MazG-like family protein [Firmicutes bacterium ADurb.Bin456]
MLPGRTEGGIAKNIKVIDRLKTDLITSVSALFQSMLKGSEDLLLDALASLLIICYVLGRRLGLNFPSLDLRVEARLRQGIEEDHELERWYGDLSALLSYMADKKR